MSGRMLTTILALAAAPAFAQTQSQPTVEATVILTAADHMHHKPPVLLPADVTIMGGTITGWTPLGGIDTHLELYLLIDDNANYPFGSKLDELKQFVTAQPRSVAVGIAYIHEGALRIAEKPTTDHARAVRALRPPSGSKAANPYCEISDLIAGWHNDSANRLTRREIILVSTGIDDTDSEGVICVNAETAIHDAERTGVVIYALYNPVADYVSRKWNKVDAGVIDLAHVCFETGGEAYFLSHLPVNSLAPFLADIQEHLTHQYLVRFRLPENAESGFEPLYVNTSVPSVEIMVPERVWVAGSGE